MGTVSGTVFAEVEAPEHVRFGSTKIDGHWDWLPAPSSPRKRRSSHDAETDGRLLLLLTSRDPRDAAQWFGATGADATEALHRLQPRIDAGFIIASDSTDSIVYQLTPRREWLDRVSLDERLLIIEDDLVAKEMRVAVLEAEGCTVIASEAPAYVGALRDRDMFDVAITDGFHSLASAVFVHADAVFRNAGVTAIALFSARVLELEHAQAQKLREQITRSCDAIALLLEMHALSAADALLGR